MSQIQNETLPKDLVKILYPVIPIFCRQKAYFLTLKGSQPKYQKMDTIRKMLAKVSNNYIVVREPNKATTGYHFHAIFRSSGKPKKNWFRKGVHMHLKELNTERVHLNQPNSEGRRLPPPNFTPTNYEISMAPDAETERYLVLERSKALENAHFQQQKNEDFLHFTIANTIKYMQKNLTTSSRLYHDYIAVIKNKNLRF